MNYYFDTEFLEGPQKKKLFGIKYGETKPTIDLISIGVVCEDGREYYAISKDFNLKEAWNRCQFEEPTGTSAVGQYCEKEYWIRENVLKPIHRELSDIAQPYIGVEEHILQENHEKTFSYWSLKMLLGEFGKSNKEIANEIKEFTSEEQTIQAVFDKSVDLPVKYHPKFYAYYADYDWVVFCWLFGTMMNLPKGFPMYCIDLKQIMDEKELILKNILKAPFNENKDYPTQENEHNALDDARWNKKLHEFLKSI